MYNYSAPSFKSLAGYGMELKPWAVPETVPPSDIEKETELYFYKGTELSLQTALFVLEKCL